MNLVGRSLLRLCHVMNDLLHTRAYATGLMKPSYVFIMMQVVASYRPTHNSCTLTNACFVLGGR